MIEKKIVVTLEHGFHIRPAKQFVNVAGSFQSEIKFCKNDQIVDGKSMLSLMMLAVDQGEEVTLSAEGEDEHEAIEALAQLLLQKDQGDSL
jgi:phosphotransferase system HPr (HPr) family protein